MNGKTRGKDVGPRKNPAGRPYNVRQAPGPDGWPRGSYYFPGRPNSYIYFPNNGGIDARKSITVIGWVYPEKSGPIFHYNPRSWGVHIWYLAPNKLFARFQRRSGRTSPHILSHRLNRKKWSYFGATYDHKTGLATLWVNGQPVAQRNIGVIRLATNHPAVMGKKTGDRRYFRGRISCVQVYDVALTGPQIRKLKKICIKGMIT